MNHSTLFPRERQVIDPHNATLIAPNGKTYSVNISPEAAVIWERAGLRVEWFATEKKVA